MTKAKRRKTPLVIAIILVFVLLVVGFACLTPQMSMAPEEMAPESSEPIAAEATSIAVLASLKIDSETQPDGSSKNIASLSINSLGIGTLELETPEELDLHETSIVKLSLALEDAFTNLPGVTVPDQDAELPSEVLRYTDEIDIYPVMNAELIGSGFEISSNGSPQKIILSNTPVEWIWSIKPKEVGTHSLTVIISIPVVIDQERDILSTHVLQNIPVKILVTESFGSKISGALPWLIPTIITVVGGLIGFYLNYRRKQ